MCTYKRIDENGRNKREEMVLKTFLMVEAAHQNE